MFNIDIAKIRTLLKFDGIQCDFTDEELEILVDTKIRELEGYINADILPHDRVFTSHNFKDNVLELGFYPIIDIHKICLNGKELSRKKYTVNYNLGIIYFRKLPTRRHHLHHYDMYHHHRTHRLPLNVKVEYTTGIDDRDFDFLILPLLKDMIGYTLSMGSANQNLGGFGFVASSVREGDVSVTLANGGKSSNGGVDYGYSPSVNSKIDDLVKKYKVSARIKWL